MMKTETLAVDLLTIDADTQARCAISDDTVEQYAEIIGSNGNAWEMGPLDVFHDGSRYMVADGFHRTLAALQAKRASVPCRIHAGTAWDALVFGMTANDHHGLRMSQQDKRRCVELLLDKGGSTQRQIAELAGVSLRTVSFIVAERKAADAQTAHPEEEPAEYSNAQSAHSPSQSGGEDEAANRTLSGHTGVGDDDSNAQSAHSNSQDEGVCEGVSGTSIVLDAIGREVPQDKRAAMELAPAIQSEARKLDAILRRLLELAAEDGGQFLSAASLTMDFKSLKGDVFGSCYWSECPKCKGVGGKCRDCNNHGWWPNKKKGHVSEADKKWLGVE